MKLSIIAAGTMMAVSGMAQSAAIILDTTNPSAQLNNVVCPTHVDGNVNLAPSANVKMAFDCQANSTVVKLGTCHQNGLVKTRSAKANCGQNSLTDANDTTSVALACDATGDSSSYNIIAGASGASFFSANTGGGSAGAVAPNGKSCDSAGSNLLTSF